MKTTLVRYRLNESLESLLQEAAHQHGAQLSPLSKNLGKDLDNIESECDLIVIEFPMVPDTTEVIRARQWCLANPSHTLLAIFQSSELHELGSELFSFIDDYGFANSNREQLLARFKFALNAQLRQQDKLERIRQSLAVEQLMISDYETILGSLAEGVVYQGANDEVLYANNAACEFLGLSHDQLMGKTSYDPRWAALKENGEPFLPGEHPSAITLRVGKPMRDVFMSIRHSSGAMRQMTLNTQPLFTKDSDRPSGVIVSFRDRTGMLDAQKERDELRDQLLQSQKMEALGTLAGGIAHDFNNLLTPILALSQRLKKDPVNKELSHQLSIIESNALSARDLINQILTFSRKKPDLIERVNLSKVVSSVSVMLREFPDSAVTIVEEIEENLFIDGDSNQLTQLFLNIMTNAIKALEGAPQKTIKVRVWQDAQTENLPIKVRIEDSGAGIPNSIVSRIYEPFFTTSEPGKGTGLGLSVAHNVVKSHGGSIDCISTEGVGTRFTLSFDKSNLAEQSTAAKETEADTLKLKGEAIILDDNTDSCDVLAELVEFFGMKVHKFNSPLAALESVRLREGKFDVIISDFSMPEMNGFEFASAVREFDHTIPIAIITGYGEGLLDKDREKCDAVLAKPIQLSELESALRK
jgi:PAS domain S-box-containing protein